MSKIKSRENEAYAAIEMGELEIDSEGRIWRVAARRYDRWAGTTRSIPCARRRAENPTGEYLQVRVMIDGRRIHALAQRMVWRHFFGPVPDGKTINHKNGDKLDNRPENLEPATDSEQQLHAIHVLGKAPKRDSHGSFVAQNQGPALAP